jgi:hypothetical protein
MNFSRQLTASAHEMKNKKGMRMNNTDKKYCGVCYKAGKSASEYQSHYTKSVPGPNGIITCPVILTSICKSCGNSGHFSDHCKKKRSVENKNHTRTHVSATATVSTNRPSENMYSALATYVDDEMPVVKRARVSESDSKKEIETLAPNGISFATILMKPAPAPVLKTAFKISPKIQTLLNSDKSEKLILAEKILSERKKSCSWLDSDSDDEDDNDYIDNSAW